ncbi:MAG: Uma2 family endonuclease [Leptolyngbya sp. RL_3_1]|nr:Uma2 family endonuclease [Leptolyngbya sp. RL_3_1]
MVSSPLVAIPPSLKITDEQFLQLVRANPELRMERTATGVLITMSPTGSEGGSYNAELTTDLVLWNRRTGLGKTFDSSTGFRLPNGAIRSPDAAWVMKERWASLTSEQRQGFAPVCPDFVIELASPTDSWVELQAKMQEYVANGCRLGWLIEPRAQRVEIYRPDQTVAALEAPAELSGEGILPGLVVSLSGLFEPE